MTPPGTQSTIPFHGPQAPKWFGHWLIPFQLYFLSLFSSSPFFNFSVFWGFIQHDRHFLPQCLHSCFLFVFQTLIWSNLTSFRTLLRVLLFRDFFSNHSGAAAPLPSLTFFNFLFSLHCILLSDIKIYINLIAVYVSSPLFNVRYLRERWCFCLPLSPTIMNNTWHT